MPSGVFLWKIMNCMNSSWKKPQKGGCWGLFRTLLGKRVSENRGKLARDRRFSKTRRGRKALRLPRTANRQVVVTSSVRIRQLKGGAVGLGGIKLADYADPRAVSRGVGLAASAKAVADRTVRRDDDTTIISAQVASASGIANYFETSVMFGDFESRIVDYECTCPAIARFDGLCKHCVALVTTYFTQPRSFRDVGANRAASRSQRTTVEALARCLAQGATAPAGAASRGAGLPVLGVAPGSVHLTPHLAFDGRLWSLRLDAEGPQGTYVVRDLEALAHRVQRGSTSPTAGRSSPLPIGSRPSTGLPRRGPHAGRGVSRCRRLLGQTHAAEPPPGSARCACERRSWPICSMPWGSAPRSSLSEAMAALPLRLRRRGPSRRTSPLHLLSSFPPKAVTTCVFPGAGGARARSGLRAGRRHSCADDRCRCARFLVSAGCGTRRGSGGLCG